MTTKTVNCRELKTVSKKVEAGQFSCSVYRIKCLNLINFRKSMKYNPLAYIRSEKDILKLVNALIMNTKGEGEKSSEDFWVKAERLYYSALIGYIWYEATEEEKNFITLLDLINASEAREDDETYQSPVDLLFSQLEEREPDHFAVKQYRKFKMAAGKTLKSILISCGARLAPFDIKELRDLMEYDELELDTLGAQGLYNISTPVSSANARPGDLIFFVGTYDTSGVSHVGIYVGGGKMLHCGDPIQYADINTSYWQSHFYAFGRPPYN